MVTNNLQSLKSVDYIYVVDEGKIKEEGTYRHLMKSKGLFAQLVFNHLSETIVEGDEDDGSINCKLN